MFIKMYEWLLYVTNNEAKNKKERMEEEIKFDIAFFLIETVGVIIGSALFIKYGEPQWIPILLIEYCWAFDQLRHNRED